MISRKHTGERPFQCHCSRRFSRLDNLRQHAQTVHVNEEIPGDSLAATGTRFQRQIRTDRVRPPSGRARAGTGGSQGSQGRGHSRGLSASSIGSVASTTGREDSRRRPPPLIMASDSNARNRLSLDTLRSQASTPPGQYSFLIDDGASTPTSTTFSTGQNSPGYGSSFGSPSSTISRSGGVWDGRSHARRLSVPSGPTHFGSPQANTYPSPSAPYLSPLASSTASTFSNFGSTIGSPIQASYTISSRNPPSAAEEQWRRRTWHPNTYSTNYSRPVTSGLLYSQTPDAPRPAFASQSATAANQPHRLPGIETFDQLPRRPATPPVQGQSPMQIDPAIRPPVYPGPSVQSNSGPNDRRGHASWDMSLHQNLTKLDIASGTAPTDISGWHQQSAIEQASANPQSYQTGQAPPVLHQESQKRELETPNYPMPNSNRAKRQGMYIGHVAPIQQRPSPGDSSSSEGVPTTPSYTSAEHHPSIVHSNGYVESAHPGFAAGASYSVCVSTRLQEPHSLISIRSLEVPGRLLGHFHLDLCIIILGERTLR